MIKNNKQLTQAKEQISNLERFLQEYKKSEPEGYAKDLQIGSIECRIEDIENDIYLYLGEY